MKKRSLSEVTEREEAEAEFPAPLYPEPTPAAFNLHRENLLVEIDRQSVNALQQPRVRRRITVTVFSAAVAFAAITAVVLPNLGTSPAPKVAPASTASVQLLEQAALTATVNPPTSPRNMQFMYVKVTGHTTALSENQDGKMERSRQSENYEQWTSVDGSSRTVQRQGGANETLLDAPGQGSFGLPTYRFLEKLPTDPTELLKVIYREAELNHGEGSDSTTGPDQQAFVMIGDLLRASVAPPEVSAALYRAAAHIPGVIAIPSSVDAAGRRGVAVARVHDGERSEWIFDKETTLFLGERTVLLEDNAWGKAGTAVTSTAVTASGVTDKPGQAPMRPSEQSGTSST
ncbi:MAG TPA: CU044_5270 family protein [Streptomyces sp.]|uniref:CU044_5270 family protein n=1 Tax=Streptomyces sp. TaxID=1931 RepID=UPI002C354E06|nr:CU044_5270 family protein [Streptomyces sp.]HWU06979.1 CU044_5270 family protein [Streptomyces sp.]